MSGFCALVNDDQKPVDPSLLQALTTSLAFRGPDHQALRLLGPAGLGHALLRTDGRKSGGEQPAQLDGRFWIVADARIDAQADLRTQLALQGEFPPPEASDAELVLHAYRLWGADCVLRLIGDFSFALWDAGRAELFCVRDAMGVKPLFYAEIPGGFVCSNTLRCVLAHPDVSKDLDDLAVADFLMFEHSLDTAATIYAGIRRLPPGSSLRWRNGKVEVKTYWRLDPGLGVSYRRQDDYVEHFLHLLGEATRDRLRTDAVTISLSGGLDSSSVACLAQEQSRQGGATVSAYTAYYESLIPDQERRFASEIAAKLGLPHRLHRADDYPLFHRAGDPSLQLPEPYHHPFLALGRDQLLALSESGRVVLTGDDGDGILNESPKPYFRDLFNRRDFGRLFPALSRYAWAEKGRLARQLMPARGGSRTSGEPASASLPDWLDEDLVRRLGLRERWAGYGTDPQPPHPIRPYAHAAVGYPSRISNYFDQYDAGVTGIPLEHRHPFMDLRLVSFCLSLPVWPWCIRKEILKRAMHNRLPLSVLQRAKTPLAASPLLARLERGEGDRLNKFVASPDLSRYVCRARIPGVGPQRCAAANHMALRPLSLDLWLRGRQVFL